mgnify:CR=1 FL=1
MTRPETAATLFVGGDEPAAMNARRRVVAIGLVAVLVTLAGCGQAPGGGTPSATPGASAAGPAPYGGSASEYLLSADRLAGWEANGTRAPGASPAGLESGRVAEFENGNASLQIAVLVFASPADARSFLAAQRETYRSDGINVTDVGVGDRGFATTSLTETAVDTQQSNVYVQVLGTVSRNASEQYARAQLRAITDG